MDTKIGVTHEGGIMNKSEQRGRWHHGRAPFILFGRGCGCGDGVGEARRRASLALNMSEVGERSKRAASAGDEC